LRTTVLWVLLNFPDKTKAQATCQQTNRRDFSYSSEMLTPKNYVHRHFPTNNWQNWGYFLYEGGADGILNYAN